MAGLPPGSTQEAFSIESFPSLFKDEESARTLIFPDGMRYPIVSDTGVGARPGWHDLDEADFELKEEAREEKEQIRFLSLLRRLPQTWRPIIGLYIGIGGDIFATNTFEEVALPIGGFVVGYLLDRSGSHKSEQEMGHRAELQYIKTQRKAVRREKRRTA